MSAPKPPQVVWLSFMPSGNVDLGTRMDMGGSAGFHRCVLDDAQRAATRRCTSLHCNCPDCEPKRKPAKKKRGKK